MNQTERFYRIDQLIHQRGVVAFGELMRELEVSRATLKRDLAYLRDRLNAPIVWDRARGGYCFSGTDRQYELPGLWFNDREILALLTMHRMLEELDTGGLLGPQIAPLIARLRALLGTADGDPEEIVRRVRLIPALNRPVPPVRFELIGSALVKRQRIEVSYYTRSRNAHSVRELSPQRLVHYRNAWYLDAWCHLRGDVRSFAVDAIRAATILDASAHEVPEAELDAVLAAGYGIFGGRDTRWAVLRFTAMRARWVAHEQWHPQQRGRLETDGSYVLEIPFSDERELVMDILRLGEDVEVLEPPALRERVRERLAAALARYG